MCAECVAILKGEANASKIDIVTGIIITPGSHWERGVFHWDGAVFHGLCSCTAVYPNSRRSWDRSSLINAGGSQDSRKTSF